MRQGKDARRMIAPRRDGGGDGARAEVPALRRAADQQRTARATASTERLARDQVRDLAIGYHGALEAVRTGRGTQADTSTLAIASNVALMLCEQGLGEDWIDKVREAQDACVTLEHRRQRIGRVVASGTELQRLTALLDLHDAQLESDDCTEGLVMRALREIERRAMTSLTTQASCAPADPPRERTLQPVRRRSSVRRPKTRPTPPAGSPAGAPPPARRSS